MAKKPDKFAAAIAKARKAADAKALQSALGALVKARTAKAQRRAIPAIPTPVASKPVGGQRRSPRRLGRFRAYTATSKPDVSRFGTFRRYMLATIRAHSDTLAANAAHATCDNPKFAKNKLDFNWAADNGYITFN